MITALQNIKEEKRVEQISLKACFKCGHTIQVYKLYPNSPLDWIVFCTRCGAEGPKERTLTAAITSWNKVEPK